MDPQAHFPPEPIPEPSAEPPTPVPETESPPSPPPPDAADPSHCPLCRAEVNPGAIKCAHCGSLLAHAKVCPRCAETVHEDAQVCRFCGHDFERESQRRKLMLSLAAHPHRLVANPFGVLFSELSFTGLFFPPELHIRGEEVVLTRWSLLGLRRLDQRLSTHKIASVRYLSGVIWGGLMVETFGGALSDLVMHGLNKQEATETARLLEQVVSSD